MNFCFLVVISFLFFLSFFSKRVCLVIHLFLLGYAMMILHLASIAEMSEFFNLWGMKIEKGIWLKEELMVLYDKNIDRYFPDSMYNGKFHWLEEKEEIVKKSKNPEEMLDNMFKKYREWNVKELTPLHKYKPTIVFLFLFIYIALKIYSFYKIIPTPLGL